MIYFIESITFCNTISEEQGNVVSPKAVSVKGDKIDNTLVGIYRTKRDYVYTILLENGQIVKCSIDHILCCVVHGQTQVPLQFSLAFVLPRIDYISLRIANGEHVHITKITRSKLKHVLYDVSVDGDHVVSVNDGVLVHNCTSYDTSVEIYDPVVGKHQHIPIFELYYKYLKNKNFLTRIEYRIQKWLYKLEKNRR